MSALLNFSVVFAVGYFVGTQFPMSSSRDEQRGKFWFMIQYSIIMLSYTSSQKCSPWVFCWDSVWFFLMDYNIMIT